MRFEEWQIDLHGHGVIYRVAGAGPPVVLIHGMVNSSRHWEAVALRLAVDHTVIAPELIGHGDSATPRGDYSLGAYAASIRDLLASIGVERATLVGHSQAAAWRCNSSTSSPSAPSASCWCHAAGSVTR